MSKNSSLIILMSLLVTGSAFSMWWRQPATQATRRTATTAPARTSSWNSPFRSYRTPTSGTGLYQTPRSSLTRSLATRVGPGAGIFG